MTDILKIEQIALEVLRKQKFHLPQAIIIGKDGKVNIIAMSIKSDADKKSVVESLRKMVDDFNSESYYLILEAWVTLVDKQHNKETTTEAVIIHHFQKNKPWRFIMNKFSKTESGDIVIIERNDVSEGDYKKSTSIWDVWNGQQGHRLEEV